MRLFSAGTIPRWPSSLASSCESDLEVPEVPEVWDDGVDLGFLYKCLYPVVTGCKEMDWSHVSHILTPLDPFISPPASTSTTAPYFRLASSSLVGRWG